MKKRIARYSLIYKFGKFQHDDWAIFD